MSSCKINMPIIYVGMIQNESLKQKEIEMKQISKVKGGGNGFSFDFYGSDRKDEDDKGRKSAAYDEPKSKSKNNKVEPEFNNRKKDRKRG